jgi:hypothetical protein
MKRLSLAVSALIGLTQAVKSTCNGNYLANSAINDHCHHHEINYDYTCRAGRLEDALENDIPIYGPNVLLVNLDNRREVRRLEREGIFLQTGDLLFVTGREYTCAGQEWEEPYENCENPFDYDILFPGLDYDMPLRGECGHKQEIVVLEAVGSGETEYDISLYWGGEEVRDVSLRVYVDQQPGLVTTNPRHSCCERDEFDDSYY